MIVEFLSWYLFEVPREILRGIRDFLKFGIFYFPIPFFLKTLFSHWHRYVWRYPKGFDPGKYFEVFFSNLISRIIGAIARIFLIFIGLIFEILILFFGTIVILAWFFLPIFLILGFIYGIKFLL
jgi:hypothetical protein